MTKERDKPFGMRGYGSIPHLKGSQRGDADRGLDVEMSLMLTSKRRNRLDNIIVTEKLDGSCMAIWKIDNRLVAVNRSGYNVWSSPYPAARMFGQYVIDHTEQFSQILNNKERLVGEWLIQAIGSKYHLTYEPFVPFDIMIDHHRIPYAEFLNRIESLNWTTLRTPHILHEGAAIAIDSVDSRLGVYGKHGCLERAEGAVWRLESDSQFKIIGKYVRPGKHIGKYLPSVTNAPPVWNSVLPQHQIYIDAFAPKS